jgi:hypothetical protein
MEALMMGFVGAPVGLGEVTGSDMMARCAEVSYFYLPLATLT